MPCPCRAAGGLASSSEAAARVAAAVQPVELPATPIQLQL
ncbi:hypothetical protein PF003_g21959 [Phytophthora fragariae]|nr:hypothetical protein PF003_g21959 [Phytophthora fragariae]